MKEIEMKEQQKTSKTDSDNSEFQVVDKRHFLDMDSLDMSNAEDKPRYPSYVEELKARTAATEQKFEEKKKEIDEEIARTKKRLESDFERRLDLDRQKIVLPFLEVMDNLQRAIAAASQADSDAHLLEGVRMTADLFLAKLQAIGVEPVETLEQPFDPNSAQAIGRVPVEDAGLDGIVVEEVQPGYSMDGQLLRPAKVRVGFHE